MATFPVVLFIAQLAATLFMTGLIWFVQLVHYPLFATVFEHTSKPGFLLYERRHATRTGWVVFPPMAIELLTAVAALFPSLRPAFLSPATAATGAGTALLLWLSTGLLQVPLHNRLSATPDLMTIDRLIRSNWTRTFLWTARALLLIRVLPQAL